MIRTNKDIVDSILVHCGQALGVPVFSLDSILYERENMGLCDKYLYDTSSGLVLQLRLDPDDKSNFSAGEMNNPKFLDERKIIVKYALSVVEFELSDKVDSSRDELIKLLEGPNSITNQEFLNVLYLMILFDYDSLYKHLVVPLAHYAIQTLYAEFIGYEQNKNNKR